MRYLRYLGVSRIDLAEQFGVTAKHVTKVCCGRAWKHLSVEAPECASAEGKNTQPGQ